MKINTQTALVAGATDIGLILLSLGVSQAQVDAAAAPLLITECKDQLPQNKQYTMNIDLYINTREGEPSTLDVILLDDDVPESLDIPEGTEEFINCALRTLGIPPAQI